jgi:hypothetical protein
VRFDVAVCDEGHRLKNAGTVVARVLRSVAPGLAEHVAAVVETASTAAVERAANEAAAARAQRTRRRQPTQTA